ncbi:MULTISPECIES: beta-ketoacyl-ACP synthase II [Streptomyces]|uniref:3-oxoacyl-[acyl-carrier-protein] synthase 2 n=1 Tax=Streptomyces dengpaensis TaxID=2049881 RepID=A0ABM6SMT9_9ACTN|nr:MULTISPECIES: beta-ketoacyl-ACP synthase II [Streptomyces]AVH55799.1 beta-ketoacyl-[acyl-carrier-protein] synthase II [Streptomyces dengpaensis]PIB12054.1 beta-ketoacyl-[acyl-carrier-protein] synthase II [Streptomyces sp. HG99]
MRTAPRTVVVTGLGMTTPLGGDVPGTWEGLLAGRSGARTLTETWAEESAVRFACRAAAEPGPQVGTALARRTDRSTQFALVAAREAWQDAGAPRTDPDRLGVVLASGLGGVTSLLDSYDTLRERGPRRVSPHTVPMFMPNGPAAQVGLEFGARAGVHATASACASGAEAIGHAIRLIRSGAADVVIAGGAEAPIHPLPMAAFANMMALSKRNDAPERASRPYDKGRDGFVMGEGAGVLVLESAEHAAARGARVLCQAAGVGLSSDAHHIAQPEPGGRDVARAIAAALAEAGARPEDVVHVNAHATSTPMGDLAELAALRTVLGSAADQVAISATKSMTGHLLGATGAVESAIAVLALGHRLAPPTINLEDPDERADLDIVRDKPRELTAGPAVVLNNSFGFGGHNVALAFRAG